MEGAEASWPADAIEIGRVTGAWGLQGWIRIQPHAADPQALFASRIWWLARRPPGAPDTPPLPPVAGAQRVKVAQCREHGDHLVARLQEVDDRTAAEALKGLAVVVGRSAFPTPEPDEYYWVDLIGCEVTNREGDRLGTVQELFPTGPNSVMRIVDDRSTPPNEVLVPFVAAYVDQVVLAERRIRVDWQRDD